MEQANEILCYVASEGVNPFTGEVYPDGQPRLRTVSQIFNLLQQGYEVEDRTDGMRVPLDKHNFFLTNSAEILGLNAKIEIPDISDILNTATVGNTEGGNKPKKDKKEGGNQ